MTVLACLVSVRMFSKCIVGITLDNLQQKLEDEVTQITKRYQDTQDSKESLEIELAEVKTQLETEKTEKTKVGVV